MVDQFLANRNNCRAILVSVAQPFVSGPEYETVRGTIEWPKTTSRGAKRRGAGGLGKGCLPPQGMAEMGARENFDI